MREIKKLGPDQDVSIEIGWHCVELGGMQEIYWPRRTSNIFAQADEPIWIHKHSCRGCIAHQWASLAGL